MLIAFRLWLVGILFEWILALAPIYHPEGMIAFRAVWRWSGETVEYFKGGRT